MKRAMAMIGSEKSRRKATTSVIQMKTGTRNSRIPFARRLKNVTMKFTAEMQRGDAENLEAEHGEVERPAG